MTSLPGDVKRALDSGVGREIGSQLRAKATREFEKIKAKMMEEFETHPVTIEIRSGPDSDNTSGTLGGYGNLFSFIGFPSGDNPMEQVRQMLESTQLKYINISRHGVVSMITTEPSRDQLFEATKMSDFRNALEGGRSWLDGIETGLSGLGSFLFREEGLNTTESRSGTGLQLKGGKKSEGA